MDLNFEDLLILSLQWLSDTGLKIGLGLALILAINRVTLIISGRLIHKAIISSNLPTKTDEKRRENTLRQLIHSVITITIWLIGAIILLSELNVDVGPLIASAGILGFALGFGAQELVKDFIAGVFIILENQYRVGDWVDLDGVGGVVEEITVRTTVLRDLDGYQHHIPNGQVTVATNKTIDYNDVNMIVGISYDSDIKQVEKIVNKVGLDFSKDEEWSKLINEPPYFLRVENFGDSSVDIKIMCQVVAGQRWAVAGELRGRIKQAFDKNGIEIPFPQRVIHNKK